MEKIFSMSVQHVCDVEGEIMLPCKDGDTVMVSRPGYEEAERELFMNHIDCDLCPESVDPTGAFVLESEVGSEGEIGLCWNHLKESYSDIMVESQPRNFVYMWQRAMNSGIVEFSATQIKHVRKAMYGDTFCKNTLIVGDVVSISGEQN